MPATPEQLLKHLENLGLSFTVHHHAAVMTVDESRRLRGDIPGLHAKNLLLKDKKGCLWLVVALESRQLDLKALRRDLGAANLSFASAEVLDRALGVSPGAVTPFAMINDTERQVTLVLDQDLAQADLASYHPLCNTQSVSLSGTDLLAFLASLGVTPRILDLDGVGRN